MTTSPTASPDVRRAYRDSHEQIIGGVAAGLARHLGLPVLWVRAAFVVAVFLGGLGIAFYGGLWLVLPHESAASEQAPGLESASRAGKRPGRVRRLADLGPVVALGAIGIGAVFLVGAFVERPGVVWAVVLGLIGLALLWRQADEAQRERWVAGASGTDPVRAVFGRGGVAAYARVGLGVGLILIGFVSLVASGGSDLGSARDLVVAGFVGIGGLALVVGPWIYRMATDLTSERAERVRTQERADIAAHLHDSVLQTLALIQKNAGDGLTVARLARAQERDLRSWLYAGEAVGNDTVASALRAAAAGIEDDHGVAVDVVNVGDCPVTEGVQAIIGAAREAMTNAAKHAGTARVDVYAEVSSSAVDVFVRDRGRGFDPGAIPEDRLGIRRSIEERMERHGGSATVKSTPGEGTEVRLRLPREDVSDG